jgi:hypothetical protein
LRVIWTLGIITLAGFVAAYGEQQGQAQYPRSDAHSHNTSGVNDE